ncbi:MAG: hypothetical protein EBS01_03320 [Verrucomicrobia bacterium]|nr:hypothetical protein [Verrucomicrobiota bacterium]
MKKPAPIPQSRVTIASQRLRLTRRRRVVPASRLRRFLAYTVSAPVVEAWTDYGPQQVLRLSPAFTRAVTFSLFFAFLTSGVPLRADTLTLSGDTVVDGSLGSSQLLSDGITGTGNLLKTGDSVLTLGGSGSLSGDITVNGGVLVVKDPAALGSGVDMITVNGNSTTGWDGGMLVLDAGTSALAFNQNLSLDGRGATTNNSSAALLTLGNVTLNGDVQLGNSGAVYSYINSGYGNLTIAGDLNVSPGGFYGASISGNGNTIISGAVSGSNSLYKPNGGYPLSSTLWLQNPNNSFGTLNIWGGYVRVSNGGALGKTVSMNSGMLEIRADASGLASFAGKTLVVPGSTPVVFVDHAVGGSGLAQNIAFGSLSFSGNYSATFSGRNGYGVSYGDGVTSPQRHAVSQRQCVSWRGYVCWSSPVFGKRRYCGKRKYFRSCVSVPCVVVEIEQRNAGPEWNSIVFKRGHHHFRRSVADTDLRSFE